MTTDRFSTPLSGFHRRRGTVAAGCLALVLGASTAAAGEAGFYAAGKFHHLIVSHTEFAVELADPRDRPKLAQRTRTSLAGVLEDVPWGAPGGRFAILRVADASVRTRMRARKMDGFRSVNPVYRLHEGGPPILSSGRIVVRLRSHLTAAERDSLFADYKVDLVRRVEGLAETYVVDPLGDMDAVELETARALHDDDRTLYAHPDFRMPVDDKQIAIPGLDTFFDQQWHLQNTGQGGGTPGADINIFQAYNRTLGAGIRIGQLDDACDVNHEDLAVNYIGTSHDTATNAQNATAANPQNAGDRHGTATMGLMVAAANSLGVSGVAPSARFTASRGLAGFVSTSQVASAYTFARNLDVDVHNNSWGFGPGVPNPDVIVDAIRTAFEEGRNGLGIVICFASGNGAGMDAADPSAIEVTAGEELGTLSTVIGVGASNADDAVAFYSNFGRDIDVLAPSNDFPSGDGPVPAIVTTDNTDGAFAEPGYNNGGFDDTGQPNLADPSYTDNFGGTSASSPIVAGIAALILSLEPDYTATQVRGIIEHTCDQISPAEANYNGITSRSLRYGYGRVNAGEAVESTFDGFFWPERVADVRVEGSTIFWKTNDDLRQIGEQMFGVETVSVLVAESDTPFSARPADSTTYVVGDKLPDVDTGQPSTATVVANIDTELYTFTASGGIKYFGIFSVAQTDRRGPTYGFGVSVTSLGGVIDSGTIEDTINGGGDGGGALPPGSEKPRVSIEVDPLSGNSPLTVSFTGNAQSVGNILPEAEGGWVWDFGDGATANTRSAQHTYVVATGSQRFFPRLTVTDENGKTGQRSVAVDVFAADATDGSANGPTGSVTIRIASPDSPNSDISSGFAPLSVLLSAEITGLGASADALEVFWDLGDGNTANSLSVAHTYQVAGRFPITVSVTASPGSAPIRATRFIDVFADPTQTPSPTPTPTAAPGNGTSGPACGAGMAAAFWAFAAFALMRRPLR